MTPTRGGWLGMVMIVRTPLPSSPPPPPRARAVELDLARCVGTVAELVLEALDVKSVACAIRKDAGQQEARQSAWRLREHEERIAHRRRHEPLVAGDRVLA